jgi:putative transposase
MILTHKTECYPNTEQIKIIETNFGLRRFFFNKTISLLKNKYGDLKANKKLITKKEVMEMRKTVFRSKYKDLTALAPSVILNSTMEDVLFALDSLWKKGKQISLRKKKFSNTCRYQRATPSSFRYLNKSKYISTIKLNNLKLAESLRWDVDSSKDIKTITIKKEANRYFISISVELPNNPVSVSQNRHLGIDWGIKTYLTMFDGTDFYKEDFDKNILLKLDKKIAKYQKSLARKVRFSKNWLKAKTKLGQAYLDFTNYRLDLIRKAADYLDKHFDSVTLEDLGMKFVTSNKKLAKKALQKPFYLFKITLINKFKQTGKLVFNVPRNYPSTQTCNVCGFVKTGELKMKLGEELYVCDSCEHEEDRDFNAAINLYNYKDAELAVI